MGRNREFETEHLKVLIDLYFKEIQVNNINTGRITPESIARHYRESGQEPKLFGRHIIGDAEAIEDVEEKLEEMNKQIKAVIPIDNIFIWRTFTANDFYNRHKNDPLCGLNIISEYLDKACKLIDELNALNINLNKQIKKLSEQIRDNEKIISGKGDISNKHYAQLMKERRERDDLQKKFDELQAFNNMNNEAMKQAVLSDMHIIPIRCKPNTYAKTNSYLGEPETRTPPINKIIERLSLNETSDKQHYLEKPYWEGLIDGDTSGGREKE